MTTEPGLPAGSHAVLIGVSAYEHAEFPPIRAARNSLQAMRELLSDPALCGWPPERVTVIANPLSAADLAGQVADLAETTTGVLLLYYAGHGALSACGELCLTVTSTCPDRPKITGLHWDALAEVLRASPARARIAILDCCFASQAIEALAGDDGPGLADITHVQGVYTLTATTRNHTAHVPPPDRQDTACTSFTGELRDLIHAGIPGAPSPLTLGDIYPVLRDRLRAKGLPVPNQRGTDTAGQFPFAANLAAPGSSAARSHRQQDPGGLAVQTGPTPTAVRTARLLDDAIRTAQSIPAEGWANYAAAGFAGEVVALDPDRAVSLARSIPDGYDREMALADMAKAVAAADTDRAERLAQSITDKNVRVKVGALVGIAQAVAAVDSDRAERLLAHAERLARSAHGYDMAEITTAISVVDPDCAKPFLDDRERDIWSSLNTSRKYDDSVSPEALANMAMMAAVDPDRAERLVADAQRLVQSITDRRYKASALVDVVKSLTHGQRVVMPTGSLMCRGSARSSRPRGPAADRPDDHAGHLSGGR